MRSLVGKPVLLVSFGGTIAMTGDAGEGVSPTLDVSDLAGTVTDLVNVEITTLQLRMVPGVELGLDDVLELARVVDHSSAKGFAGIVVTQGTDTLEETAFALDFLVDGQVPVVLTGAMVSPSLPGADGAANLLDAIAVASSGSTVGFGPVVVMAGEVHAAALVRKTHPSSPHAFTSITGPLGWVTEGQPVLVTEPVGRNRPAAGALRAGSVVREGVAVALVKIGLDDEGRLLDAVKGAFDGLAIEAPGAGHVPATLVNPLEELAASMPVLLCSRTGGGPLLRRTYGFPGSERDLLERGLISAGYLDGLKARVALALLLRAGAGHKEIASVMRERYGARE